MKTAMIGLSVASLVAVSVLAVNWSGGEGDAAVAADAPRQLGSTHSLEDVRFTKTRAGFLRATDPILADPSAAPMMLAKIGDTSLRPALRIGWADAWARYVPLHPDKGAAFGAQWLSMIQSLNDHAVADILIRGLRKADTKTAMEGLAWACRATSPELRAAAMATVGWHAEGRILATTLMDGLADADTAVRAAAARSLGWLKVDTARDSLVSLLNDGAAAVRLEAVRALGRIDADYARNLPAMRALVNDADPKVARAAAKRIR